MQRELLSAVVFAAVGMWATLLRCPSCPQFGRRGRRLDNVFIERLWRSLKYEDIYLKGYADGCEARAGIESWVRFYNHQRPHQVLQFRFLQLFAHSSI